MSCDNTQLCLVKTPGSAAWSICVADKGADDGSQRIAAAQFVATIRDRGEGV
jgi:hypothetical protein